MILNKYDRTTFLTKKTNASDELEWDLLLSHWEDFKITQPISFDTIQYGDIARPDTLCYRIYGASKYWWILCKVNQIDDVWNDMVIGKEVIVPNIIDIENYYSAVRRSQREN
jgi:hypothetical protein